MKKRQAKKIVHIVMLTPLDKMSMRWYYEILRWFLSYNRGGRIGRAFNVIKKKMSVKQINTMIGIYE